MKRIRPVTDVNNDFCDFNDLANNDFDLKSFFKS